MSSDRRRSMPNRAAKRKASEDGISFIEEPKRNKSQRVKQERAVVEHEEMVEEEPTEQSLAYRWIDQGKPAMNSQTEHQLLEMVLNGVSEIFAVGDCVLLRADSGSESEAFVAKIERMWQISSKKSKATFPEYLMKVRTRWFFKKSDVEDLGGNFSNASLKKSEVLANMKDSDVILSNQADDNDVLTLLGKCTIIHRDPKSEVPDQLPPRTFVSRYSLNFAETTGVAELQPYNGENQPWPTKEQGRKNQKEEKEEDELQEIDNKEAQKKKEVEVVQEEIEDKSGLEIGGIQEYTGSKKQEEKPSISNQKDAVKKEETKKEQPKKDTVSKRDSQETDGDVEMDDAKVTGKEDNKDSVMNSDENIGNIGKQTEEPEQGEQPAMQGADDTHKTIFAASSLLPNTSQPEISEPTAVGESTDDETSVAASSDSSSVGLEGEGMAPNLDEGSNTKGKIMVGPEHQVPVPKFEPAQKVVSRGPTQVWKQDSNADLDSYFHEASLIINKILKEQHLWMTEQYLPLPQEKMHLLKEKDMTISKLSTASSITPNHLTRECNLDAIMALLHDEDYNTKAALKVIAADPTLYITKWTQSEKDAFNYGFRKFSGSLRMIAKSLAGESKDFKEVVDYHYRFKIPDQFRKRQDRKRLYAIRMMEILEDRRANSDTHIPLRTENTVKNEWPRKQVSDPDGDMQARRIGAKEFLIQVKATLGDEKLRQLALAIKSGCRTSDLKDRAVDILQDTPSLLNKFVQYLPKRYRE